jgi:hypothetical protein
MKGIFAALFAAALFAAALFAAGLLAGCAGSRALSS